MCGPCIKKLTMAPRLRLGIGASCTVKLRFLHLKDKVNEKVPSQSASQSIRRLIVQSKVEKSIQKAAKSCVVFRHEDFGGQLIWALPWYVTVDVQGPEEVFFAEEPQQPTTRAAGDADSAVHPSGTAQDNTNQQNDATTTGTTTAPEDLPMVIQDLMERGVGAMDVEEIGVASAVAPMVDDDNEPAPENRPSNGETVDDVFSGWTHSGICERKALISRNAKPELSFWMNKSVEPSNLHIWEGLFFMSFIKRMILPQTNNNLPAGEKHVQYGEFLCWLGLWSLLHQLIENDYFDQEAESQCHRSTRIQEGIGHRLMSLPPYKKFWAVEWCLLTRNTPPKSAIFAEERCGPTANALQVSISVVTALQTTSRKQIIHCKQEG